MKLIRNIAILALTFLFSFSSLQSQTSLLTGATYTISANGSNNRTGSYQEFLIPTTLGQLDHVEFTLKGGDGGSRRVPNLCREKGGEGASVTARFKLGTGTNELRPGGMIRVIVGKKGARNSSNNIAGGGGGGGTAILYKHPGAADAGFTRYFSSNGASGNVSSVPSEDLADASSGWVLLAVAGAGGGAYAGGGCGGENGRGGNASTSGSDGKGGKAIVNGNPGGVGGVGAYCGGGGVVDHPNCGNRAGRLTGADGENDNQDGGYGYGAGGAGETHDGDGGGGGGYSGGGNGVAASAGGSGGSFANGGATFSQKTGGDKIFNSENGFVNYTFQDRGLNTPNAICKNVQVYLDANGYASIGASQLNNGSNDAFGSTLTFCIDSTTTCVDSFRFDCDDVTTHSLILKVDNGLATSTCVSIITVDDSIPPVVTCPANHTVQAPQSGFFIHFTILGANATDACLPALTTINDQVVSLRCSDIGDHDYYFTLTDRTGNAGRCTTRITLVDNHPPVLNCPSDMTVYAESDRCGATVNYLVQNQDPCARGITQTDLSGLSSGDEYPVGTTLQSYQGRDHAGNTTDCSFSITVQDTTPPDITCDAVRLITLPDSNDQILINTISLGSSATDNCALPLGTLPKSQTTTVGCNTLGDRDFSFSYSDIYGNSSTCTTTLSVEDTTAPSLYCQDIIVSPDNANCDAAVANYTVGHYDYCGANLSQSDATGLSSGSTFPYGATTLSYRAVDGSGNSSSCSFTVTVQDSDDPVMQCPTDTTVYATILKCEAIVNYTVSSIDNCGSRHFQIDQSRLTSGDDFVTEVRIVRPQFIRYKVYGAEQTWVAIDSAGNTDTCRFTITVVDTTAPQFRRCPPNQTVASDDDICGSTDFDYNWIIGDNCTINTERLDNNGLDLSGTLPLGTHLFSLRTYDDFDNADTCNFTITVNDSTAPQFSCPASIVHGTVQGECYGEFTTPPSATDHCDNSEVVTQINTGGLLLGDQFPIGVSPLSFLATDNAGNTDTCHVSLEIIDQETPSLTCPSDTALFLNSNCGATFSYNVTSTDNCGSRHFQIDTSGYRSGDNFVPNPFVNPQYSVEQSWVAIDSVGNTDTCTFMVTVQDSIVPNFRRCPEAITVATDPGSCTAMVFYIVGYSDNCSARFRQFDGTGFRSRSNFPLGVTPQAFRAYDNFGNDDTCSFNITVYDAEAPVLSCPSDTVIQPGNNCQAFFNYTVSSTDNCGARHYQIDNSGKTSGSNFVTFRNTIFPPSRERIFDHVQSWVAID
ncbi:MAG: HYR domain-containing protein, partial [Bacteroidia bacterium]